jgi:beta-glucosidase
MPRRALALLVIGLVFVLARPVPPGLLAQEFPFRDPALPLDQRIDDLVGRLTIEEKVRLMVERAAPVPRLGLPAFPWWNEALHGVARAGRATVFPQAIGLAATWDAELMHRVATAISDEARAMHHATERRGKRNLYQGLTFWSPNINIFRDPRWGRGQETYGEDPVLTGVLGVAFVRGMQGEDPRYLKTVTTPKHYAVHSGPEPARHTFDARPSPQDLHDTYLAAFRATVVEGKAESVMCAYNSVDGKPACGSNTLLTRILREQWGFGGYVVSDCGAVIDIFEHHKVRPTPAAAAAMAVKAGCDLECGAGSWASGEADAFLALAEAMAAGEITVAEVDAALRRLLRAQFKLGVYDPQGRVPFASLPPETVDSAAHQALALEAARKSIVLLKNDGALPLRAGLESIAVIGPNAAETDVLLGNYYGTPARPVSVLDGIRARAGAGTKVLYAKGSRLADGLTDFVPVPASALFTRRAGTRAGGLQADYFARDFDGLPVATRLDANVNFDWADGAPVPGLDDDAFSVRWRGEIVAPVTGRYVLGFQGATGFTVFLDGRPIIRGHGDHEPALESNAVVLQAGKSYALRIDYYHQKYDAIARLLWEPPAAGALLPAALDAARAADAVVLVLGLNSRLEGEEMRVQVEGFRGGDRTTLDLPRAQQELLEQVVTAAATKPVVTVLLAGSAVAVNWADAHVPAILQAWYPGQAGGTAVADVLFGAVSPGGRLPVTVYRSASDLPPFDDYAMKGRTYRFFEGAPLYPFGHGLSYGRFEYSDLQVPATAAVGTSVPLSVTVRNAGTMAADEVVQVYLAHDDAPAGAPRRALKAFRRVALAPGQAETVRFTLDERALSLVGPDGERSVGPGRVRVSVGGKQPGVSGTADASTTQVVTAALALTGPRKTLAP